MTANAAQKRFQIALRELGCRVCRNEGLGETPASGHHCETGAGGRKDEWKVIPLCPTHHQGTLGIHVRGGIGLGREKWEERFGTEQELMQQTWDELGITPQIRRE